MAHVNARIVLMGTPDFGVPVLKSLAQSPFDVVAVYTRPDRPAGRGRHPAPSPVKQEALKLGIPVIEPETLRNEDAVHRLQELAPDLVVVAAFSYLLPRTILDVPSHGCLNVHPSLLPRHRGASPVASALLSGDEETGVSIMLMDEGLDTGPVVQQERVSIADDDTTGLLTSRLAELGARLLTATIGPWIAGEIKLQTQREEEATYSPRISAQDGWLDWTQPAHILWRQVRAYHPWPGSHTLWKARRLKVHSAAPVDARSVTAPGTVVVIRHCDAPVVGVQTGEGVLGLRRVQLEGKRETDVDEFVRGHRDFVGSSLPS